jgi:hypothetical protein
MAYKKKTDSTPQHVPQINDPAAKKKIRDAISEICVVMQHMEDNRAAIKDVIDMLKDTYSLPPKYVRKVARARFKADAAKVKGDFSDFEMLYGTLYGVPSDDDSDDKGDIDDANE